jgi:hypothetical protein
LKRNGFTLNILLALDEGSRLLSLIVLSHEIGSNGACIDVG